MCINKKKTKSDFFSTTISILIVQETGCQGCPITWYVPIHWTEWQNHIQYLVTLSSFERKIGNITLYTRIRYGVSRVKCTKRINVMKCRRQQMADTVLQTRTKLIRRKSIIIITKWPSRGQNKKENNAILASTNRPCQDRQLGSVYSQEWKCLFQRGIHYAV